MRKIICILLALLCAASLTGCGIADISEYGDSQILVTGLLEEDFYITPNELMALECTTATAQGKTAKAGTVHAYGPTLETFLAQYGKTLDEFKKIKFYASDDYTVTLGRVTWEKYDVIMSVAEGSDPLPEYQWPLRIVIPGADSGNWVRLVVKIEFTYKSE